MIPEAVVTALAFYRQPQRYGHLRNARAPLPPGISDLLAAQTHSLSDEQIAATAAELGSTPAECQAAAAFFIKQVLLEPRGDHYRTLGVPRDADEDLIRQHYRYLMRMFHPDRDVDNEGWDDLYAPVINEAYSILRRPERRADYDLSLADDDNVHDFDAVFAQQATPVPSPRAHRPSREQLRRPWWALSPRTQLAGAAAALGLGGAFVATLLLQSNTGSDHLTIAAAQGSAPSQEPPAAEQAEDALRPVERVPDEAPAPAHSSPVSIEEQVRRQVNAATVAVLGPPGNSTVQRRSPRQVAAKVAPEPARAVRPSEPERPVNDDTQAAPEPDRVQDVAAANQPAIATGTDTSDVGKERGAAVASAVGGIALAEGTQASPQPVAEPARVAPGADGAASDRVAGTASVPEVPAPGAEPAAVVAVAMVESPAAVPAPTSHSREVAQVAVEPVIETPQPKTPEAAPEPPPLPPIAAPQLTRLLADFGDAYEAGDAKRFAALFSDDARTSDAVGRADIQALYAQYFSRPERREMRIGKVRWRAEGDHHRRGTATAEVATLTPAGIDTARGEVKLRFEVRQTADGPRITALTHP